MKLFPASVEFSTGSSTRLSQKNVNDDVDPLEDPSSHSDTESFVTRESSSESDDEVAQIQNLSRKETSSIRFWRFVVAFVIVGAGALVSTGTFLYITELEQNDAWDAFVLFSNTIEDISRFHFKNMFEASRAMSREMTAEAVLRGMTFPYISFPNYEVFATQAREAAGLEVISYAPVVTLDQVDAFINYTVANQKWISDSRRTGMLLDHSLSFDDINNTEFIPQVYDVNPLAGETFPSVGDGPFAPLWHTSPPPQSLIYFLYNFASDPEYETIYALQEDYPDVMFGNTNFFLATVADFIQGGSKHQNLHEMRHHQVGKRVNSTQPHGSLVQPVFSSLDETKAKIAGYIMGVMAFDAYLIDLLPDGVRGIYVVVENTCGAVFTYRLNGNQAEFLGVGDLHQSFGGEQSRRINFDDNYKFPEVVNIPGHCVFSYQVYSSELFNSDYSSNLPVLLTCVVAVLFLIMAIGFFMLMLFVERRHNKVVGEAAISNAIISSLYPSSVRKRLFADRAALLPQEAINNNSNEMGKNGLRRFLKASEQEVDDRGVLKAKPIADLFRDATIMFADIAGFTSWSSNRQPAEVFTLLETLYRSFDAIAAKMGVFKVETIGDCYVAVCSVPVPRKNHAVVMARFSRACLAKMKSLLLVLIDHLGEDTADLSFRVGLHSGPVTAGVLRGERSRFQLFGDSVNTAARLESNSLPGRIQISEQTASRLKEAGKSDWFTPRADKIVAKGKGELSTFWLSTEIEPEEKPTKGLGAFTQSRLGAFTKSTSRDSSDSTEDVEPTSSQKAGFEAAFVAETQVWI